jgi:serine/threonine protein kinase
MKDIPLPADTLVADRYRIERVLGRGGFALAYLAEDELSARQVVLKELSPPGSVRDDDGFLHLPDTENASAQRTVYEFLREAKLLAKLRVPGVVQIFDAFQFGGTAYAAMQFLPEALTLKRVLRSEGCLSSSRVARIVSCLARTLAAIHKKGYLHRDIKPSNILLIEDEPYLIDFGAAREWQADATVSHTALFTPGYAPIEQLTTRGRRGPASDIYSLGATAYEMLMGFPPISAVDRVGGAALQPLAPDVSTSLAIAITRALSLKAVDRPQTAEQFLALLDGNDDGAQGHTSALEQMDEALSKLLTLKVGRSECPCCGGLLDEVSPLKQGVCPVCRSGRIRARSLDAMRCAVCKISMLKKVVNEKPLKFCPVCSFGRLIQKGVLGNRALSCQACGASFSIPSRGMLRLDAFGEVRTELVEEGSTESENDFWRPMSGRSREVLQCEGCNSIFDIVGNHWILQHGAGTQLRGQNELLPDEWARLAAGLPIDAGSHECDKCRADFYVEGDSTTLVGAEADAFGFAARYLGKRLPTKELAWIGAGKSSGQQGVVCDNCETEFDYAGDYLRLRNTADSAMAAFIDKALTYEDWHRQARGLPLRNQEKQFREQLFEEVRRGLTSGRLTLGKKDRSSLFSGAATFGSDARPGQLVVDASGLRFRGRRSSLSMPVDVISSVSVDGDTLTISALGHADPITFDIQPADVIVELDSGRFTITLDAQDCADALQHAASMKLTGRRLQ